jgi:hypothetical protein
LLLLLLHRKACTVKHPVGLPFAMEMPCVRLLLGLQYRLVPAMVEFGSPLPVAVVTVVVAESRSKPCYLQKPIFAL